LIVSYGALGAAETQPQRCETSFPGLISWLLDMYHGRGPGAKDGPWLCFADFAGGQRSYANLVASHAVPLDLDLGHYAWDAASIANRLTGYSYAAWTSYSHSAERPRWRIVVPTVRPMSREEHYATWETLAALFARDCGESSKDATRLNYLPGTCLNPEAAQFISNEGALFPVSVPTGTTATPATDELTEAPIEGWNGPTDDDALLLYMLQNRRSAEDAFTSGPTRFEALWTADVAALAAKWPAIEPDQQFEHTRADAALANELAFYTGSHGTRCLDLFMRSALAQRERFREDKARRAILLACQRDAKQHAFMAPRIVAPAITVTMTDPGSTPATGCDVPPEGGPSSGQPTPGTVSQASDFFAYLPEHTYIHRPTGARWPAASLDGTVGKDTRMMLDLTHPVHALSWAPGLPERFQMRDMDVTDESAADSWVYNRYKRPRVPRLAGDISPWLSLLAKLFNPADCEHIVRYMADAVQNPGRKCNHALVMGSEVHGIGKDTLLVPLRWAVGERNFSAIKPKELLIDNNAWTASVVVQISESRNLGDDGGRISKFEMYESTKDLCAAPPATLSCVDKWIPRHQVKNVLRLFITTNHGIDGVYLPPQDRRHYCAWSDAVAMSEEESKALYAWYATGGEEMVAHYLTHLDLSSWNPGAPPPKTEWWHRLVLEGNQHDENPLADAIEKLGNPEWLTAEGLAKEGGPAVASWFADSRNRKNTSRMLGALGYRRISNPGDKRGRYSFSKEQRIVYARVSVNPATFLPR
jgi:hypothetical protein